MIQLILIVPLKIGKQNLLKLIKFSRSKFNCKFQLVPTLIQVTKKKLFLMLKELQESEKAVLNLLVGMWKGTSSLREK